MLNDSDATSKELTCRDSITSERMDRYQKRLKISFKSINGSRECHRTVPYIQRSISNVCTDKQLCRVLVRGHISPDTSVHPLSGIEIGTHRRRQPFFNQSNFITGTIVQTENFFVLELTSTWRKLVGIGFGVTYQYIFVNLMTRLINWKFTTFSLFSFWRCTVTLLLLWADLK